MFLWLSYSGMSTLGEYALEREHTLAILQPFGQVFSLSIWRSSEVERSGDLPGVRQPCTNLRMSQKKPNRLSFRRHKLREGFQRILCVCLEEQE